MPTHGRSLVAAAVLGSAALTAGCATTVAAAPPKGVRASFGAVAVVASGEPSEIAMDHPTTGWVGGVVRGLGFVAWPFGAPYGSFPDMPEFRQEHRKRGPPPAPLLEDEAGAAETVLKTSVGVVLAPGFVCVYVPVYVAGIVATQAAAVVWLPFSVAGGAVTAVPPEEADAAEAVLVTTAGDSGYAARIVAGVASAAQLRRAAVAQEAADTILEIGPVQIGCGMWWNLWSLDRPFPIEVDAHAKAIRRSDGEVLWETTYHAGTGPELRYVEWAADGGAPLRAEIDAQLAWLAEAFAAAVFGPPPLQDQRRP